MWAASWFHDGSAAGPDKTGYGNNWVIAAIIVRLPFLDRPAAIPVLAKLVVKSTNGAELKKLPARITWTTRLRKDAALCELPPRRTGKPGRPRAKGDRLPSLDKLAATATWQPVTATGTARQPPSRPP